MLDCEDPLTTYMLLLFKQIYLPLSFILLLRPSMKVPTHITIVTWLVTVITPQLVFFIASMPRASKNSSFKYANSKFWIFQHCIPCGWLRIWLFHHQLEFAFFFPDCGKNLSYGRGWLLSQSSTSCLVKF